MSRPLSRREALRRLGAFDYRRGEWMRVETTWRDAARRLTLKLAPGSRMLAPSPRRVEIRVAGSPKTRMVEFSGRAVDVVLDN